MSLPAGPAVGRADGLDVGGGFAPVCLERSLDYLVDPAECDASGEERLHRGFVGGVEDRRRRTARPSRRHAGPERAKHLGPYRLECKRTGSDGIELANAAIRKTTW